MITVLRRKKKTHASALQDQLHAAVAGAAIGALVARDRLAVGQSLGPEPGRVAQRGQQQLACGVRARQRQMPV